MLFSANTLGWFSRIYAHVRGWVLHFWATTFPTALAPPPPPLLIDRPLIKVTEKSSAWRGSFQCKMTQGREPGREPGLKGVGSGNLKTPNPLSLLPSPPPSGLATKLR